MNTTALSIGPSDQVDIYMFEALENFNNQLDASLIALSSGHIELALRCFDRANSAASIIRNLAISHDLDLIRYSAYLDRGI
jgi:hypothetical protein